MKEKKQKTKAFDRNGSLREVIGRGWKKGGRGSRKKRDKKENKVSKRMRV
jgi:hypothetical protein